MTTRLAALLTALMTWCPLASAAPDPAQLVDHVIATAGIDEHLQQLSALAAAEIESRREALDPGEYERLRNAMLPAYEPAKLRSTVVDTFMKQLDMEKLTKWSATLQEPLMKDMAELERKAGSDESFDQVITYMRELKQQPPPARRMDLVRQLDSSTGASEIALDSQLAITRSLLQAINTSLPADQQLDGQRTAQLLADLRNEMAPKLDEITTATLLFAYRDLSDDQLRAYLDRYTSPEGQWATATTKRALRNALDRAAPP